MKKRILAACAPVALAFGMGAVVPAAVAEVPITLNAGVSQWYYTSDHDLENEIGPMVGLEWAFNDAWAAELSFTTNESKDELFRDANGARRGDDVDVTMYGLGIRYYGGSYIGKSNRIRPYLALGAGYLEFDPQHNFASKQETGTANGGVGVRWMITQRFGANVDWRAVYGFDDKTTDSVLTAGLNYYFGNVTPPAPPAPLDSDGDGVTDDIDQCPGTPAGTRVDSVGCPLPVAQVASIKLKVNFGFDSTVVQEQYFSDLAELAEFLKRFEDLQVDVEGHTDSTGPDDYNQTLSQNRAQAVVDMLVNEYGIAAQRLEAKGYGETQPVASNDTEEGRAENRRVMATLEVEYSE